MHQLCPGNILSLSLDNNVRYVDVNAWKDLVYYNSSQTHLKLWY